MIRLYRAPWSTNVERVALALAHKGLAVESIVIDYSDRGRVEQVSGQSLVPVIEDGDHVVSDSTAILRFLEGRYPDPPLFAREPARRAEMEVFLDWFNESWKRPPNELEAELLERDPDRTRIDRLAGAMAASLERFEAMLTERDYLMGNDLSATDCVAFPFLKYARGREAGDDELFHRVLDEHQSLGHAHGRLAAWIDRVDAHPRAY